MFLRDLREKPGRFYLVILKCTNSKKPSWFESESLPKPREIIEVISK
jgi:hypothetical protein